MVLTLSPDFFCICFTCELKHFFNIWSNFDVFFCFCVLVDEGISGAVIGPPFRWRADDGPTLK